MRYLPSGPAVNRTSILLASFMHASNQFQIGSYLLRMVKNKARFTTNLIHNINLQSLTITIEKFTQARGPRRTRTAVLLTILIHANTLLFPSG